MHPARRVLASGLAAVGHAAEAIARVRSGLAREPQSAGQHQRRRVARSRIAGDELGQEGRAADRGVRRNGYEAEELPCPGLARRAAGQREELQAVGSPGVQGAAEQRHGNLGGAHRLVHHGSSEQPIPPEPEPLVAGREHATQVDPGRNPPLPWTA